MIRFVACAALLLSSPASAQTSTVRFAAFGDYGNGNGAAAVSSLVHAQRPDFAITVGDNCYGASPGIASQVGNKYGDYVSQGRFFPALGNHEFDDACGGGNGASGYKAYFTLPNNERYYEFVRGPVHFFALNSASDPDGLTSGSRQGRWLRFRLAASNSPWNIVYFHHANYSSGLHGSTTYMQWPFEQWGADAVIMGHDHDYERIMLDSNNDGIPLPHFVTGLGGQSNRAFATVVNGSAKRYNAGFGALFVTASSTRLFFDFRNVNNVSVDSYTLSK